MTASAACGESIIDAFGVKEMFRCGMSLSDVNEYMKEEEDDTFLLPEQHRHHLKALLAEEDTENENEGGGARRRQSLGGGGAAAAAGSFKLKKNHFSSSNDILSMSRDSKNSISDVILFDNEGNFGRRSSRGHHESQNGLVAYQRGGGGDSSSNKSNSSSPLTVPQYSQSTSALRKQRKRLERRAEQQFNQPQHNATWNMSNGKIARRNNSSADLLSMSSTMKYNADGSYK